MTCMLVVAVGKSINLCRERSITVSRPLVAIILRSAERSVGWNFEECFEMLRLDEVLIWGSCYLRVVNIDQFENQKRCKKSVY